VHEYQTAFRQALGVVGQTEHEGLIVETAALIVDLNLKTASSVRYADESQLGTDRFVAVSYHVHEELSDDEEQSVGIRKTLTPGEHGYALQNEGHALRFGDYGEIQGILGFALVHA
jgi:hypothetical protein